MAINSSGVYPNSVVMEGEMYLNVVSLLKQTIYCIISKVGISVLPRQVELVCFYYFLLLTTYFLPLFFRFEISINWHM
jgi:hypothetical protein